MNAKKIDKDLFERVQKPEDIQRVWTNLFHLRTNILAKIGNSGQLNLRPELIKGHELTFSIKLELEESLTKETEIIGQFSASGEMFFFHGTFSCQHQQIILKNDIPLFKIQRRQNYRVKVPTHFSAKFTFVEHKGKSAAKQFTIYDLSAGGCCLKVPEQMMFLTSDDSFKGNLELGSKPLLEVQGKVRHIREIIIDQKKFFLVGIHFTPIAPALEAQLFNVTMELSRHYLRSV